jgi:ABC-type maltose transport system permease subunit
MNDKLQAQITEILAQIMTSVGEVKDFSLSQLPDIAQQYITYGIWSTTFYLVFCVLTVIVCIGLGYGIIRYSIKTEDDETAPFVMFPMFIGFIASIALLHNINQLILVLTAPKVWFLLEIKNLLS